MTAVICVPLFTVVLVAETLPKNTSAPARKFVPVIVTVVSPAVGPLFGEMPPTVGHTALYVKTADELVPAVSCTLTLTDPLTWAGATAWS